MPNLDDPRIALAFKVFIGLFAVGLLLLASFGVALTADWYFFQGQGQTGTGNAMLSTVVLFLPALSGPEVSELGNMFAIFGISIPLIAGKVCFEKQKDAGQPQPEGQHVEEKLMLSRFGFAIAVVLVLSFFLAIFPYFTIEADVWGDGHTIEEKGVAKIQEWIKAVMRTSAMYLAALLGVKAGAKSGE